MGQRMQHAATSQLCNLTALRYTDRRSANANASRLTDAPAATK